MFKGYVGYGSPAVQIINVARLVKYAAEGGAPGDTQLLDPQVGDYSDLAAALGDAAYRTVLLDAPPWYDATNPDSADFAGLLPLEIGNLDGSTRTRSVIEGLEDGGAAGRSRGQSRVIPVTVLALASSDAALDAGLTWLAGVLHPPCAGAPEACGGAPLNLFSAAPTYCDTLPNLDADLYTIDIITEELNAPGPSISYEDIYGRLQQPICAEVSVTAVVSIGELEEGEDPYGRTVVLDLVDSGGTVYASSAAALPPDGSPVTITLTVEPSPGFPREWQPILRWYGASIYDGGDSDDLTDEYLDGGGSEEGDDLVDGGDADGPWGVGPAYGGTVSVTSWTITQPPLLTAADCLTDLRRSYRNVVTIEGPTVVEEYAYADGTPYAAKIEWTWVATDPVPYGDTLRLLGSMVVGRETAFPNDEVAAASTGPVILNPTDGYQMSVDGFNYWYSGPGVRVLLKDQDDPAQNGIYVTYGPFGGEKLQRAADLDTWAETAGAGVHVSTGWVNYDTTWVPDVDPGGTIGVTPMPWIEVSPEAGGFYDNGVVYRAPGLQIADNTVATGADTECPLPEPEILLCGDDPDLPLPIVPPRPPSLVDPGMPYVETYTRREFQIPPEVSPQPGGVLTVTVRNLGTVAYRGIRVRLWADDDPDFGVTEECAFEQEFYITYIAPSQTVIIEGLDHWVTTTCATGIDADHERNMRGPYGGPFTFPQLRCGDRYHVTVDVPITEDAGGISVDLSVTRRGV